MIALGSGFGGSKRAEALRNAMPPNQDEVVRLGRGGFLRFARPLRLSEGGFP